MAMTSMKTESGPESYAPNPYGSGLSIYLTADQVEALGIKAPLPAGSVVSIQAIAMVKSATQSVEDDGDDNGPDVSLELQITDMEIMGKGQPTMAETANLLYGS